MLTRDDVADALTVRRSALQADLERLTTPPPPGSGIGFGKRVGDGTAEAVERLSTTAAARSLTQSLAAVERALAKIADGSYGWCDSCGAEIPAARLSALPATSHCFTCRATLPQD